MSDILSQHIFHPMRAGRLLQARSVSVTLLHSGNKRITTKSSKPTIERFQPPERCLVGSSHCRWCGFLRIVVCRPEWLPARSHDNPRAQYQTRQTIHLQSRRKALVINATWLQLRGKTFNFNIFGKNIVMHVLRLKWTPAAVAGIEFTMDT